MKPWDTFINDSTERFGGSDVNAESSVIPKRPPARPRGIPSQTNLGEMGIPPQTNLQESQIPPATNLSTEKNVNLYK